MMSLSLIPATMQNSFGKYSCSSIMQKEACAVMWTGRILLWSTKPMRKQPKTLNPESSTPGKSYTSSPPNPSNPYGAVGKSALQTVPKVPTTSLSLPSSPTTAAGRTTNTSNNIPGSPTTKLGTSLWSPRQKARDSHYLTGSHKMTQNELWHDKW